jgi:hypothetical protein
MTVAYFSIGIAIGFIAVIVCGKSKTTQTASPPEIRKASLTGWHGYVYVALDRDGTTDWLQRDWAIAKLIEEVETERCEGR